MADFDLKQLNNRNGTNGVKRMQTTNVEKIDVTAGKVTRKGNYVSPAEARQMSTARGTSNTSEVDPVFDTPPTFKVRGNQDNIQSLDSDAMGSRSPVLKGKPTTTPVVHSVEDPSAVPDPVSLKVVNNLAHKINMNEDSLTPFDINSLPKKKPEMGQDESEDMIRLDEAVEREKKNISERVRALTEAQYHEYLDAKQEGKELPRLMTDEEVAKEEEDRINKASHSEDEDRDDTTVTRRIVIKDDQGITEANQSNETKVTSFETICMSSIRHVDNHVTAKDYFTRVMHAKSYLAKNGIYSEIWAIVMYNHEGEHAVHPFLVAKKDGITGIIELNLDNIKGLHTLDPNDTIDGLYNNFLHRGYLYEYIDFLAKSVVVKLPADMPTIENAVKLANQKLGENSNMEEIPMTTNMEETPIVKDELDDAVVYDEANSLYGDVGNDDSETTTTASEPEKNIVYSESYDESTTEESIDDTPYNSDEEVYTSNDENKEDVADNEEDSEPFVISKAYDGDAAYEAATSDELSKDLEEELNVDVNSDRNDEAMLEELKDAVKRNIKSITKRINLREFDISDTPISAAKVAGFSISDVNQADWVLPNAKRVITVRGLSGPELFSMNPQNTNKNKINTFRQIYGIMYKHIVSKKPKTFDEWLKVTRFSDIDHIYAALHRATFAGSNFVHYECPECNHVFVKDFDFEDMVAYESDEAKEKIHRILNSGDSSIAGYDVQLSQISDNYVVGLKDPSIWNMVMETAALSDDFLTKYEDLLDTMSFIDSIYVINRETRKLDPIDFDYDKDNPAKSTARKIMILSDIIRTLSSDSYFDLRNQIAQMFASSSSMTYQIPAAECPRCNHKFEAERTEGVRLLFTRHQLGALGVI